ncbi:hypothetical protein F8M41_006124 [Gigaspora margarita]|uniref:Uncharacterized protein n=1 Tax=Gigaspora margarita TaxID=4874 RepID=A0A8H4B4S7_GIGMA|nr:hypothetical protein F8M41_006124 [Gigaspora margarita]
MIVDDTYVVLIRSIDFCEYQKLDINLTNPVKILWLKESNEPMANKSSTEKVARTIASRVKNTRRKNALATRAPYLKLKDQPKVTDLAKSVLNQDQNIDYPDPSTP